MEEWTKIIVNANPPVPSTPLTPYAQPYQLEKHGCALDNEKIKKVCSRGGFSPQLLDLRHVTLAHFLFRLSDTNLNTPSLMKIPSNNPSKSSVRKAFGQTLTSIRLLKCVASFTGASQLSFISPSLAQTTRPFNTALMEKSIARVNHHCSSKSYNIRPFHIHQLRCIWLKILPLAHNPRILDKIYHLYPIP